MMHNKQPYSFEKTDVRGRFLLNFSCTKVQSKDVSPIAGNVWVLAKLPNRKLNLKTKVEIMDESLIEKQNGNFANTPVSRSTFYQGDCLVEMSKIADKSVDMILCDLPYGTTACKWDSVIPFEPLWKHYERVIKDNGAIVLTASNPFSASLISSNYKFFRHQWVWVKSKCGNFQLAKKQPLKYTEDILVFGKKSPQYNPICEQAQEATLNRRKYRFNGETSGINHMASGKYFFKLEHGEDKIYPKNILFIDSNRNNVHPTEKPVELMEYLIKTYTNEGETVLDNCMGSGTTGVACKKTGRHFIGIEKDEKYFEIAVSRVSAYCG